VETVLGTGIAYIPIADMPPLNAALVWPRQTRDPRLRAFVEAARAVLRTAS
jgi:DNA-binding transcriptional LysR family regulator